MKRHALYSATQHIDGRLAARSARLLWAYYRDVPSTSPALSGVWEITNACDADCSFCGTHPLRKRFGERTRDEILRIADALVRAGLSHVNISGGEPLVAKHIFVAMDRLLEGGVKLLLNSNGSCVAELADELVDRVSVLTISLDSMTPEVHDRIRRKEGLTALIFKGIDTLAAHPRGDRVSVRVRSVITPENFR
ncbi:MAG: radical SAM protein, partial [Myxococcota bacterium]|nr:radical SAM protein [Myxococcota bacterium]